MLTRRGSRVVRHFHPVYLLLENLFLASIVPLLLVMMPKLIFSAKSLCSHPFARSYLAVARPWQHRQGPSRDGLQ